MSFFKKLNNKGQESAPFELLVAVIIMTFVIVVGTQALGQLNREQCVGEINKKLHELKSAIETTISDKSPQNVDFYLPECFIGQEVFLEEVNNEKICSSYCDGAKRDCVLLKFSTESAEEVIWLCVNVSPTTIFESQETQHYCTDRSSGEAIDYRLVDFFNSVDPGYYLLIDKTPTGALFPVGCAYRQEN